MLAERLRHTGQKILVSVRQVKELASSSEDNSPCCVCVRFYFQLLIMNMETWWIEEIWIRTYSRITLLLCPKSWGLQNPGEMESNRIKFLQRAIWYIFHLLGERKEQPLPLRPFCGSVTHNKAHLLQHKDWQHSCAPSGEVGSQDPPDLEAIQIAS